MSVSSSKGGQRRRWWISGILVVVGAVAIWGHSFRPLPHVALEPGRETTFLGADAPSRDGLPDYAAILNADLSEGVTPASNAVLPLLGAMGWPAFMTGEEHGQARAYERLGFDTGTQVPALLGDGAGGLRDECLDAGTGDWTGDVPQRLEEWLRVHEQALDLVEQASRRAHAWFPVFRSMHPGGGLTGGAIGVASLLLSARSPLYLRARVRLKRGELALAVASASSLLRLSALPGSSQAQLQVIVSQTLSMDAKDVLERVLARPDVPGEIVAAIRGGCAPRAPTLAEGRGWRVIRLQALDAMLEVYRRARVPESWHASGIPGVVGGDVDINEVLRRMNERFDAVEAACREPTFDKRLAGLGFVQDLMHGLLRTQADSHDILERLRRLFASAPDKRALATEELADGFCALMLAGVPHMLRADTATSAQRGLLQLACRLRGHARKSGRFPETLQALGRAGAGLPADPFSGTAFEYERTADGCILRSAGCRVQVGDQEEPGKPDESLIIRLR